MPGRVKVPLVEGVEVGPRVGLTFGEPEHHANGRESVIVIAVLQCRGGVIDHLLFVLKFD